MKMDNKLKKELRSQGKRLGRDGLSQLAIKIVDDYIKNYPNGHYKQVAEFAGKLHVICIAAGYDSYWGEITWRGIDKAISEIKKFEKKESNNEKTIQR